MYATWDMEHNKQNFLSFWASFCLSILQMCTINDNHMVYGSWEMGCNRQNFFSFWTAFCPFTPPNNLKNQNFEKMKKTSGDAIILHTCNKNDNHMMYGSWDTERNRQTFFSFWNIFYPFTLLTQKIKILKKWKKQLKILSLYTCVS